MRAIIANYQNALSDIIITVENIFICGLLSKCLVHIYNPCIS